MSVVLEAPFPGSVTALLLPNPLLGDLEGRDQTLQFRRSIDGTRYTYIKTSDRKRLTFTWEVLGRGKLVEVQEFYKNYTSERILLTDFRGDIWDVIFSENPITITMDTRSANAGGIRFESGSLTLEFLGAQIS